jgi:hypothetical protein
MKKEKHKWRICPLGEHWVITHPMKTKKGNVTTRHGHCAKNKSGRDQIYPDELELIAAKYFSNLTGPPANKFLGFSQGNKFDNLIRGWSSYWNELFGKVNPIDPDLIKALIASESGFRASIKIKDGKGQGNATGLMQVTDATCKILGDETGELKDHFVNVDENELTNPNLNIAAGVRWLFRKKEIASNKLGREASWQETIVFYKGYKNLNHPQMQKLLNFYNDLKK